MISNSASIAVFLPKIGVLSETFNRKYSHELEKGGCLTLGRSQLSEGWHGPEGKTFVVNLRNSGSPLDRLKAKFLGGPSKEGLWSDASFFTRRVTEILSRYEINALFSQYLDTGIHLQKVCRDIGLRHVVRGHGYDITQVPGSAWGKKYYSGLVDFDHILVPTPFQADILMRMGVPSGMISSFPCSVDVPPLKQVKSKPEGAVRCLAVGRMVAKKAPQNTIKAFLAAANRYENIELIFVGDGPLLEECRSLKEESEHGHRIHLVGSRSNEEVRQLMSKSHLFLQHSIIDPETGDQEGAPVAILEAMAHAMPVISTKHSGIPFQVSDGETGILVDEGDVSAMSDAILCFAQNESLRKDFGRKSHERVRSLFSWEKEKELVRGLCLGA